MVLQADQANPKPSSLNPELGRLTVSAGWSHLLCLPSLPLSDPLRSTATLGWLLCSRLNGPLCRLLLSLLARQTLLRSSSARCRLLLGRPSSVWVGSAVCRDVQDSLRSLPCLSPSR